MSRRRLPPGNRVPTNLAGMNGLEVEQYTVGSWCPTPDGSGPATQVHVHIKLKGFEEIIVLRFKNPAAADVMIANLKRHRFDVWPGVPDQVDS